MSEPWVVTSLEVPGLRRGVRVHLYGWSWGGADLIATDVCVHLEHTEIVDNSRALVLLRRAFFLKRRGSWLLATQVDVESTLLLLRLISDEAGTVHMCWE